VVLMRPDPLDAPVALRFGKGTVRKERQNLAWAVGYNVPALPIAAGVFYPAFGLVLRPEFAALSMSGSTVIVTVTRCRSSCCGCLTSRCPPSRKRPGGGEADRAGPGRDPLIGGCANHPRRRPPHPRLRQTLTLHASNKDLARREWSSPARNSVNVNVTEP